MYPCDICQYLICLNVFVLFLSKIYSHQYAVLNSIALIDAHYSYNVIHMPAQD